MRIYYFVANKNETHKKHKRKREKCEECEYSILPVMSELSTMRCDRALGLWIAGTRASSVDGELPGPELWPMDREADGG